MSDEKLNPDNTSDEEVLTRKEVEAMTKPQLVELIKDNELELDPKKFTNLGELRVAVIGLLEFEEDGEEGSGEGDDEDDSKITDNTSDEEPAAQEEETDYLRKYQYKKDLPIGHPNTDPDKGSRAIKTKAGLLKEPRIRMMIPSESKEDRKVAQSVCVNGYRLDYPKQTYVTVPESVAKLLSDSLEQTEEALSFNRIDEDKKELRG